MHDGEIILLGAFIEVQDQVKIGRPHEQKLCHATLKLIKVFKQDYKVSKGGKICAQTVGKFWHPAKYI